MQAIFGKNVVKKQIQNNKNFDYFITPYKTSLFKQFYSDFDIIIAVLK
jgi:hypothetical protein